MARAPVAACCGLFFLMLASPVRPALAAVHTARGQLVHLHDAHAIDDASFEAYEGIYDAAQRAARRLTGRRRAELRAVISTVDRVAAGGGLTTSRLAMAFETIDRNRAWWTTGRLLGYGERVLFRGSDLVWQSYPGQGIQVQWLATFGRANALFTGGDRYDARLKALLAEAATLASPRAGGIAWEYWFNFDGGRPPWVSGLAQGTAVQAFARAAGRLGDPALLGIGHSALGIFEHPPPAGVRLATPAGAHYLIYSFSPRMHVLNAFIQALNGLYDFAKLANDDEARSLFTQGEAEARVEVPKYDTGSWSLYSQFQESDLGYHGLLQGFLQGLCDRLTEERAANGGSVAPTAQTPDPALYCNTAEAFARYLRTPPKLVLKKVLPAGPRAEHTVRIPYTLSKVSTVTTRVTFRGALVAGRVVRLGHGLHELVFTPRRRGSYAISVHAIDLAGNAGGASGAVSVGAPGRG